MTTIMTKLIPENIFVRLIAAILAVIVLVPPSGVSAAATDGKPLSAEVKPGLSAVGNYLAGRHAQARHDMRAAVTYLNAALIAMIEAQE